MYFSDIYFVLNWWLMFFVIGLVFLPLTSLIFSNFFDKGYIFSKILGIILVSYLVFLLGVLKILPFTILTILLVTVFFSLINILILKRCWRITIEQCSNRTILIFLFEELLFLAALFFWSYIRGFAPDIHGLEKFMDFGFINSILRADFFPPKDMWFTPFPINYYYFGHLVTAVLTKLSDIPSNITYNLMLSTIFSLTFTASFSIGANLASMFTSEEPIRSPRRWRLTTPPRWIVCGFLTAFLVTLGGNLHTLYTFFKPYINENPIPFWQLPFSLSTFPNNYWYPNATRFIYNTIHEFPIYSFVVSDLHGHVLDIPIVLLTIALLLSIITNVKCQMSNVKHTIGNWKFNIGYWIFASFLLAVMYMTNVWDGVIYFLLTVLIIGFLGWKQRPDKEAQNTTNTTNVKYYKYFNIGLLVVLVIIGSIVFSLPFSLNFKPFASGIGVLCTPSFLTKIGKIGPFLFEVDHCQRSPFWQLLILYGFFYFFVAGFLIFLRKTMKQFNNLTIPDVFVLILIFLSTLLIIIPEFIYVKDIYPAHYRANTMFKLVYQAFIMLSIASGYIIMRMVLSIKYYVSSIEKKMLYAPYFILATLYLLLVFLYPFFAISSYYGNLQIYRGLNGLSYLKTLYPTDYQAILWLNKNIKTQPVILEAQGDSYTDYARVSANTGLPTVLGWTVHEWLWRGTYDIPAPRTSEVQTLYETKDFYLAKRLIDKYNISLVFIGDLERQKYPRLNEEKFKILGKIIYQIGQTKIYQIKD